jgi:hypothetical protein
LKYVEEPDEHHGGAEAVLGEPGRERVQGRLGRGHERLPEDEVLHRVAGHHQLREGDQVGVRLGRLAGPAADEGDVASQVADGRVDLGQGYAQCGHVLIVAPAVGRALP